MINKQPIGDIWELVDTDPHSQNYNKIYLADFSYISSDEIKNVFKDYIWNNYKTLNRALSSLYNESIAFKKFIKFADISRIDSLREITNNEVTRYISFLRTQISKTYGKAYSYAYQKNCLDAFKAVIRWCQIHNPDVVPSIEIFTGNEHRGVNSRMKIEYIPDEIMRKINSAIESESNFYVKYGMIILKSTGMRLGDLLMLKVDCIKMHSISGYTINWYQHKNRREHPHLPIPKQCAEAVGSLLEKTKNIRCVADEEIRNFLFIHTIKYGKQFGEIFRISDGSFIAWLHQFTRSNDINDLDGSPYKLTSHKFRRTLATDMFSKGVSLKVIQEVLGHRSPMVTKRHYADVKDKETAEMFDRIGIIGDISKIDEELISNTLELQWFRANKDSLARMCDGYCAQPFKNNQICERLSKYQKCYTCSRYITTPEFLDFHRDHLKGLEDHLNKNLYGEHYAAHFESTIKILREIVKRLEAIDR